MIPEQVISEAEHLLGEKLKRQAKVEAVESLSGGGIHNAHQVKTDQGLFFIKWNLAEELTNFEAEFKGLALLNRNSSGFCPLGIGTASCGEYAFILVEFIETGNRSPDFWENFASRLARLHACTAADYGLDWDNFIGNLPQRNRHHADFADFFIEERLEPQKQLALGSRRIDTTTANALDKLYTKLPELLPKEAPALLHGDLWSGNFLCDTCGRAWIFDPAVYYGHREVELAFTRLFGGFDSRFYHAYQEEMPLHPGWEERVDLFNLYPLLVHVNLFGQSYLTEVKSILKKWVKG